MVGARPADAESYYIATVRDPYTIGRLDSSDVYLKSQDVSRQHATIAVTLNHSYPGESEEVFDYQKSPERRQLLKKDGGDSNSPSPKRGVGAAAASNNNELHPPLMLSVTNFSKFGSSVNGHNITGCVAIESGDTIGIGSSVKLRVTYRPVVVTLGRSTYSPEYITELTAMLHQLGATVLDSPSALIQQDAEKLLGTRAAPLAMFHCTEEIDSGADCLSALTFGFSIVTPAYVFEFFASLAENPRRPVHQLPAPATHAVPINRNQFPKHTYLRPEPDQCPFSLFPKPIKGAGLQRSRSGLFSNRFFYIPDAHLRSRVGMFLAVCGGKIRPQVEEPAINTNLAPLSYLVLPSDEFVECVEGGVTNFPNDVVFAFKHGIKVVPEHSIHLCLLNNQCVFEPLEMPQEELDMVMAMAGGSTPNDTPQQLGVSTLSTNGSFTTQFTGGTGKESAVGSILLALEQDKTKKGKQLRQKLPSAFLPADSGGSSTAAGGVGSPMLLADQREVSRDSIISGGVKNSSFGGLNISTNSKQGGNPAATANILGSPLSSGAANNVQQNHDIPPPMPEDRIPGEEDSDATPSELDQDELREDQMDMLSGEDETAAEMLGQGTGFGDRAANAAFLQEYARLKGTMAKNILPGIVRVDDIFAAARKHRYVAPTSIAFLEDTYGQCEQQIAALEALSTSPDGNRQSQLLQKQWDKCLSLQDRIMDTLRLAASLGERQAKRSRLLRSQVDPHHLPAHRPADLGGASGSMERSESSGSNNYSSPQALGRRGSQSPMRAGTGRHPNSAQLREGTRVARYHPPPPVKARIHTRPPPKATYESGDIANAKLFISIPPQNIEDIAAHRKLFLRKYGGPEGEVRFGMWMNNQTASWTSHFHRTLEEQKLTTNELFM